MASAGNSGDPSGDKTAKLDMSHGFVHHIRRNQISRDDFDKEQKAIKQSQRKPRHTPASGRPRKPDQKVYRPRAQRDTTTDAQKSCPSDDLPRRQALFRLEYEAKNGDVTDIIIYKDDDPKVVGERFGTQLGLSEPLKHALYIHLLDEIKKAKHLTAGKK